MTVLSNLYPQYVLLHTYRAILRLAYLPAQDKLINPSSVLSTPFIFTHLALRIASCRRMIILLVEKQEESIMDKDDSLQKKGEGHLIDQTIDDRPAGLVEV